MPKLDEVKERINKVVGKDVLGYASDDKYAIKRIQTGIFTLDMLMGGGVARNRFTEFYGNYSTLKTYTSLRTIARAQKDGLGTMFVDAEHSFDPDWAKKQGVDLEELVLITPDYGEQCIDVVEAALRSGEFGVIVVDSVAALIPKPELEHSAEKEQMGVMGKMTSKMMRRLTAANSDTAVILINQVREKIGVLWGKPETTTGGRSIPFYAGQRIEFRRGERIKSGDKTVGYVVTLRVEKDKTGPNAERVGQLSYRIGEGVDRLDELLTLGQLSGSVKKSGATYIVAGHKVHGQEGAKRYLSGSKSARKAVREAIRGNGSKESEE